MEACPASCAGPQAGPAELMGVLRSQLAIKAARRSALERPGAAGGGCGVTAMIEGWVLMQTMTPAQKSHTGGQAGASRQ